MPPLPTSSDGFPADMPFLIWGYGATFEGSPGIAAGEWEQSHAQKFAWARVFRPMVHGHPLTPLTRLAFVGDITSSLTHWGTSGLRYINADYTVTASRLPDGEFIGWPPKAITARRCGHRGGDPVRPSRADRHQLGAGRRPARRRVQADLRLASFIPTARQRKTVCVNSDMLTLHYAWSGAAQSRSGGDRYRGGWTFPLEGSAVDMRFSLQSPCSTVGRNAARPGVPCAVTTPMLET